MLKKIKEKINKVIFKIKQAWHWFVSCEWTIALAIFGIIAFIGIVSKASFFIFSSLIIFLLLVVKALLNDIEY